MIIRDLLHLASAGNRKRARKAAAQKWAVGLGAATTAAAMGVVTGILIAPKSGKETRADLKKKAVKSVATVKHAIEDKAEAVKNIAEGAAREAKDTNQTIHAKAESLKKNA